MSGSPDAVSPRGLHEYKTAAPASAIKAAMKMLDPDDEAVDIEEGLIFMHDDSKRLVLTKQLLLGGRPEVLPDQYLSDPWLVECVLSGQIFVAQEHTLSREVYTEMEAVAWAATDPLVDPIEGN